MNHVVHQNKFRPRCRRFWHLLVHFLQTRHAGLDMTDMTDNYGMKGQVTAFGCTCGKVFWALTDSHARQLTHGAALVRGEGQNAD